MAFSVVKATCMQAMAMFLAAVLSANAVHFGASPDESSHDDMSRGSAFLRFIEEPPPADRLASIRTPMAPHRPKKDREEVTPEWIEGHNGGYLSATIDGKTDNTDEDKQPTVCDHCTEATKCKKVLLDTDLGIDDNLAVISAFGLHKQKSICIIGIAVTAGNIPAWITHKTLPKLLTLFGVTEIPFSIPKDTATEPKGDYDEEKSLLRLYQAEPKLPTTELKKGEKGAYFPIGGRGAAEHIHGVDGMGGFGQFLPDTEELENQDDDNNPPTFVDGRLELECAGEPCHLLVIGPLETMVNVKRASWKYVKRVIWMGGSFLQPSAQADFKGMTDTMGVEADEDDWNAALRRRGNIAPFAEFNAWAGHMHLSQFLTETAPNVPLHIIPLDVTRKMMWTPKLLTKFKDGGAGSKAKRIGGQRENSKWATFISQLESFRMKNPGKNQENNDKFSDQITTVQKVEIAERRKEAFSYEANAVGRATFIRDISKYGWASTVKDGQIPSKTVANFAHDSANVAYLMEETLFDAGDQTEVGVMLGGVPKDGFYEKLAASKDEKGNVIGTYEVSNPQWGIAGAPTMKFAKGETAHWMLKGTMMRMDVEKDPLTKFLTAGGKAKCNDMIDPPPSAKDDKGQDIGLTVEGQKLECEIKVGPAFIVDFIASEDNEGAVGAMNVMVDALISAASLDPLASKSPASKSPAASKPPTSTSAAKPSPAASEPLARKSPTSKLPTSSSTPVKPRTRF